MFCFYPKLENSCGNVGHCPHVGGAALGTLIQIANHSEQTREDSLHTIRVLEKNNSELLHSVVDLQNQLAQAKLELKLERQNKFATGKQKTSGEASTEQEANPLEHLQEDIIEGVYRANALSAPRMSL